MIRALGASATIQQIENTQKLNGINSAHVLRGNALNTVKSKKDSLLHSSHLNILEDSWGLVGTRGQD